MKRILILFFLFLTLGCTYYETQDDGGAIRDTNSTYNLRVSGESEWSTVKAFTITEEGKPIEEIELVGDYRVVPIKTYGDFIYLKERVFPKITFVLTYGGSSPVYYPDQLSKEAIKKLWEDFTREKTTRIYMSELASPNFIEIETHEKPLRIPTSEVEEEFEISTEYIEYSNGEAEYNTRLTRKESLGFSRFGVVKIVRYGKDIEEIYKVKEIREYGCN